MIIIMEQRFIPNIKIEPNKNNNKTEGRRRPWAINETTIAVAGQRPFYHPRRKNWLIPYAGQMRETTKLWPNGGCPVVRHRCPCSCFYFYPRFSFHQSFYSSFVHQKQKVSYKSYYHINLLMQSCNLHHIGCNYKRARAEHWRREGGGWKTYGREIRAASLFFSFSANVSIFMCYS